MRVFLFLLAFCGVSQSSCYLYAQTFTSYFTGDTADVQTSPTGGVCLMGGAGEHDGAMTWWLQRADGGDVMVIRASGSDGYNNYLYSQLGVAVNSVETIVFDNDSAAYDPYVIQQLSRAEAVWIAGGDQWDYVRAWRDSPVDSVLNLRIAAGAPVGGISAGMAVLGGIYFSAQYGTISSATALANPYATTASIDSASFLDAPFLDNVITDTHYDDPAREGRHLSFMAKAFTDFRPDVRGIACDEYAAVCIAPDGKAHCYGDAPNYDDFVYFLQPNCELTDPSPEACQVGTPLTWDRNGEAVKVFVVNADQSGSQYLDLTNWEVGMGGNWENWYVVNGAWSRQASLAIACTGTSVEAELSGFELYPNPASGLVRVSGWGGREEGKMEWRDELGRSLKVPGRRNGEVLEFDLAGYPNGIYFLHLRDEQGRSRVKKVVVAR